MTTLGELFDVAVGRLQEASAQPVATTPQARAALAGGVVDVLEQIRKGLGPRAYTPVPTTEERALTTGERNLEGGLGQAGAWLGTAQSYLRPLGMGEAGRLVDARITAAVQALAAVRDTISSHLDPDRRALTPYAYLLRHQAAFDYLTHRYSEVAWAGGQVVHQLAQGAEHPGAAEALEAARTSLAEASVRARAAARTADHSIGAFPLALAVEPVQALPDEPLSMVTARLEQDSERLSRAAYGALHGRGEQQLSGSDLKQLSRWTALTRILSGQVLRRIAADAPEDALRARLNETAGALRTSSQAWKAAAEAWKSIVDITDPRERPLLPPPGYDLVRKGQTSQIPSTEPHPAVVISHTACVRVGHLLFGPTWTPEQPPGDPRPVADILADAGGVGPLTASLYRLPAAGWQMAVAAPWTVRRAGAGLVTDSPHYRPPSLERGQHFYPIHTRQVEALTNAHVAVMGAEQASAGALLDAARQAGTTVPRALLDASAHRAIAEEQKWVAAKPVQAPAARALPRAHVPTDLVLGRRAGLRRRDGAL
ncbi:hypothetical protein [Streptomyces sp. NPDC001717]|uniref:hypothetical protein n=1 Tax=Streptomyces sp. NPDC001717 TaxID=3364604 RepID=UPI003693C89B